jgi:RNA polymerase sigma factor (sigma-70 family)
MTFLEDAHDAPLVERARAGEAAAFERLIKRRQYGLYIVALGMLGQADAARELTCVALLRACLGLSSLDPASGFFSAGHRLLMVQCFEARRARSVPLSTSAATADIAQRPIRVRSATNSEQRRLAYAALQRLPADLRAVLVLQHLGNFSYDEVAAVLDLPIETIRSRLLAARQQLGEFLFRWPTGTTLDAHDELLLHGLIDDGLDQREQRIRAQLLARQLEAMTRLVWLRELAHLLDSLSIGEPPIDLAPQVLARLVVSSGDIQSA